MLAKKEEIFVNVGLTGPHSSCAILFSFWVGMPITITIVCWVGWQELDNFSVQDFELRVTTEELYITKHLNHKLTMIKTFKHIIVMG